ncbi:hypothetical protein EON64_15055 [archaeon]|nr:MAG: hypothetical protein EON64_15055 [archaeon]
MPIPHIPYTFAYTLHIPISLQEYKYWMSSVTSNHFVPSLGLNRYYSAYTTPRPESYVEDYTNNLSSPRGGQDASW